MAALRGTLNEFQQADLLSHISNPGFKEQIEALAALDMSPEPPRPLGTSRVRHQRAPRTQSNVETSGMDSRRSFTSWWEPGMIDIKTYGKVIATSHSKRFFPFLALLCMAVLIAAAPAVGGTGDEGRTGRIRLAVLYFDNECITDRERLDAFQKGIADTLISDFSRLGRLQVVERERLDALLSELKLQQSGLVDPVSATKIGKILGVQALLMGSYTAIGGMIRIDARLVEVETGLVLKAEEVTGRTDDFFQLEESLVVKIVAGLDIPLTTDERMLLTGESGRSFAAFLKYSRGLDEMDHGRYREAEEAFEEAIRIDPGFKKAVRKWNELQKIGKKKP